MNIKSLGVALICLLFASGAQAQAQAIRNAVPDVARPLPLSAVRVTGGPLKHAQDLNAANDSDTQSTTISGIDLQLTEDDSWMATVLARETGKDPATLLSHPMRHVLTNVLGARDQMDMEVSERALIGGETLLLCSDGLHGALDDQSLESVLASGKTVEAMAEALVSLALERDGGDNITALVVRFDR